MALKKGEKRLLIVLGIVVVVVIIIQFLPKKEDKKPTPKTKATQTLTTPNDAISTSITQTTNNIKPQPADKNENREMYETWGKNPFIVSTKIEKKKEVTTEAVAGSTRTLPEDEHKFLGIFKALGKEYALIDDLILAEGETEEGIEVLSIEDNMVICRKQGRQFILYWSE